MTSLEDLVRLRRARDRMDCEFARPLDVPALAQGALMSPGHFSRSFRAAFGESPYSYLMTRRIERATALLRIGELSVTEVCFAVGCSSLGTFSTRFTELVGQTPSAYRAAARDLGPSDGSAARDDRHTGLAPCLVRVHTRPVRRRGASGRSASVPATGRPG